MKTHEYPGGELDLFAQARNWKRCLARHLGEYLTGEVLDVGAGIGETTALLRDGRQTAWLCLEPDPRLARRLQDRFASLPARPPVTVLAGTLDAVDPARRFDCILYVDVLEHIHDDRAELARAAAHLNPGGHLVVLAPAHMRLYSAFDRSIGHLRRYARASLRALAPPGCVEARLYYLDAAGMLCSWVNRVALRKPLPSPRDIWIWDRLLVPLSRPLDALLGHAVGRSVLAIWRKTDADRGER